LTVGFLLGLELVPSRNRFRLGWDLIQLPLIGLGVLFLVHLAVDPYLPGAFAKRLEGGALLHHRYSFRYAVQYGAFLAWIAFIAAGRFGPGFVVKALDLVMALSVPVSAYAVLQNFGYEFLDWREAAERMQVISTLGNPLFLADFLAIGIVLILGNFYRRRGRWCLIMSGAALPLLTFALYATRSRGAVLALAVGIGSFGILLAGRSFGGRRWRRLIVPCVALLLVLAIGATVMVQLPAAEPWMARFEDALSLSDFSLLSRLVLWQVALRQWSLSPWIGVGMEQYRLRHLETLRTVLDEIPGSAALFRTSKAAAANEAHGDYAQIIAEWGIVGLGLFLLLLTISLVRSGFAALSRRGPWTRKTRNLAGVILAATMVGAVEMMYGFQLRLPSQILLFTSFFGFSTLLWRGGRTGAGGVIPANGVRARFLPRAAFALAGVLLAAYVIVVQLAEVCGGSARILLMLGEVTRARKLAFTAHQLLPEKGDFSFLCGVAMWEQKESPQKVLELFDQATLTSTNTKVAVAKAILLMQNHRNQEAFRLLQEYAELEAPLEGLHQARGMVEYLSRNYPAAVEELEAEVRLYPRNYEAYLYLGLSQHALGRTDRAVEAFRRALLAKPRGLEAHIQLGEIYFAERLYGQAIREYQEAMSVALDIGDFRTAGQLRIRLRQARLEAGLE